MVPLGVDGLVLELRAAGVAVSDPWDLVNSTVQYGGAVPLLVDWLQHVDERFSNEERSSATELLVRALTVPEAAPLATPTLLELFRTVEDGSGMGLRWVVGNALSVVADDSFFDEIAELIRRREYGKARQMLVLGLARSKDPRVVPLLVEMLGDDDVAAHSVIALGKLRSAGVRRPVEALLQHSSALVRREAKKTLRRLPEE
jgi:hypothetical protein